MRTFTSATYLAGLMAELDRAAISVRLAESRDQAGLTQDEMADLLGVHFRSVQNYESAKVDRIPWDKLDEWARITGRTKEWLLHGYAPAVDGAIPPVLAEAVAALAQAGGELAEALAELRPLLQRQEALVDAMRTLVAALQQDEAAS